MTMNDIRKKFQDLESKWKLDTSHYSLTQQKYNHPNYQLIIDMGKDVLPFIFERLISRHNFWFKALRDITGEDPIKREDDIENLLIRDSYDEARHAWLNWGYKNGYVSGFETDTLYRTL